MTSVVANNDLPTFFNTFLLNILFDIHQKNHNIEFKLVVNAVSC